MLRERAPSTHRERALPAVLGPVTKPFILCVGDLGLVAAAGHRMYRRPHWHFCGSSVGGGHGGTDAAGSTLFNVARCPAHHHVHGYTGKNTSNCKPLQDDTKSVGLTVITSLLQYDADGDWETNGAGFPHSHKHGFGLLNAWRLVNAAKVGFLTSL